MTEPNFSINFTAEMIAAEACSRKDLLVFDQAAGVWKVATAANRTAAAAGAQAIALTNYGGSAVGKVAYKDTGIISKELSGLNAGAKQLVRTSSAGRIERIASYTAGDDVIGYAEADGRVHLHFGLPWDQIVALGGGGASFGGSNGDVVIRASATTSTGVSPGTSGNVLTSNGSAWTSAAPTPGVTVNGSTKDLLFKTSSTVIDPIGAWTREASGRVNVTTSGYITYGPTGSTYPTTGFIRTPQPAPATLVPIITSIEGGESDPYNVVSVYDLGSIFGDQIADTSILGSAVDISADAGDVNIFGSNVNVDGNINLLDQLGIYDSNESHRYLIGVGDISADRTCSLPALTGNDTFTFNDFAQTLQNKSLGTGTAITTATITNTSQVKMTVLSETYSATTTDATTANLATFTLTDNAITGLDVIITATTSGATSAARYKRSAALKRASGTAVQVGSTRDDATDENSAAWDSTIDLSGSTARVRITGEAGTTITWTCELRRQTGTP